MSWKIKVDEESKQPVFDDGKPVYIDPDGKELALDPPAMYQKIIDLGVESKGHRTKKDELSMQLELFTDIEDLPNWKKDADAALEQVANFNDKDWLKAEKVEKLKADMKTAHDENVAGLQKSFSLKEEDYQGTIGKKDLQIRKLMIDNKFATHPLFSGKTPKSNVLPAMAVDHFGKQFKIEENAKNGELSLTGYYTNGDVVYSKENPGEVAAFHEAMFLIFDKHPDKEAMLPSGEPGSGAGGGGGGDDETHLDDIGKLEKEYAEAHKNREVQKAIALKNKIHALKQKSAA
jgi:hypothetical protein